MKKHGFTLAEVLISLGIIGVVSAITMPALTANYQKKTYEAGVKKAYNTASIAVETYMANEGIDNLLDSDLYANTKTTTDGTREKAKEFMNQYFKVAQDCGKYYHNKSGAKCFAKKYQHLDRSKSWEFTTQTCSQVVTLTDGTAMCLVVIPSTRSSKNWVIEFDVDINGVNGPNISGRDLFCFHVNSAGKVYDKDWTTEKASMSIDAWTKLVSEHSGSMTIGRLMADGWQMLY